MHVRTATWIIAVVHLIIVGYIWLMMILHHTRYIDRPTWKYDNSLTFLGFFGEYGSVTGATIWLIFILLLIYGLHTGRSEFLLAHLIACAIMIILLVANVVTNILHDRIDYWLGPAIIAGVLVFLLYIEYRCWEWMRGSLLLPH